MLVFVNVLGALAEYYFFNNVVVNKIHSLYSIPWVKWYSTDGLVVY